MTFLTEIKPRVIKYRRLLRNRLLRHRWHDVFHIVKNITTQQFNDNSLLYNVRIVFYYIMQLIKSIFEHFLCKLILFLTSSIYRNIQFTVIYSWKLYKHTYIYI